MEKLSTDYEVVLTLLVPLPPLPKSKLNMVEHHLEQSPPFRKYKMQENVLNNIVGT